MLHKQGIVFRRLVVDDGMKVLRINGFQKAKRQRLDRLLDRRDRRRSGRTEGLFQEDLRRIEATHAATQRMRVGIRECQDRFFLVDTADTCLGSSFAITCAASSGGRLTNTTAALRRFVVMWRWVRAS